MTEKKESRTFRIDNSTTLIVTGDTRNAEILAQQFRTGFEASRIVDKGVFGENIGAVETTPHTVQTVQSTHKQNVGHLVKRIFT